MSGHHINSDGRFQSDKHPELKPDHIVLDFHDPAARQSLRVFARDTDDSELADDITERLDALAAAEPPS